MSSATLADNRISPRRRVIKGGKIIFNQRNSVIDCTVLNVSQTGALVSVAQITSVPDAFELRWEDKVRLCTIVWRKFNTFGVSFET